MHILVPLALALFSSASLKREGLVRTTILDPGSEGTNEDFLALVVCLIRSERSDKSCFENQKATESSLSGCVLAHDHARHSSENIHDLQGGEGNK